MINTGTPLTVLLPTYNCANFLPAAIKSILMQSFQNYEFLIIDDGSTDNTTEVVSSFPDNRIKYVKKSHSGLASSLNYGLKIAKYDWVARMDADDIAHPERLQNQVCFIGESINVIISSWAMFFKGKKVLFSRESPTTEDELKEKMCLHNFINHPSVVFNKNYIIEMGGYNEELEVYEDYELWLRIMNESKFKVIPKHLVFMREYHKSLGRKDFTKKKNIIYELQKMYCKNAHIKTKDKNDNVSAWQEYFYGSKKKARKIWLEKEILFLKDYRISIAFVFTLLPIWIFEIILSQQYRLRMEFIIKKVLGNKTALDAIREFKKQLQN